MLMHIPVTKLMHVSTYFFRFFFAVLQKFIWLIQVPSCEFLQDQLSWLGTNDYNNYL